MEVYSVAAASKESSNKGGQKSWQRRYAPVQCGGLPPWAPTHRAQADVAVDEVAVVVKEGQRLHHAVQPHADPL